MSIWRMINLAAVAALAGNAAAGVTPLDCNAVLQGIRAEPTNDRFAYRLLGSTDESSLRCEGKYSEAQSASIIGVAVASFSLGRSREAIVANESLILTVGAQLAPAIEAIRFASMPLHGSMTYRMDARVKRGEHLKWTTKELLAELFQSTEHLGFVATATPAGGVGTYYLPVQVKAESSSPNARENSQAEYQLLLRFQSPIRAVWFRTADCSEVDRCDAYTTYSSAKLSGSLAEIMLAPRDAVITKLLVLVESVGGARDELSEPLHLVLKRP